LPINRGTFSASGAVVTGPTSQTWLRCPVGQTWDGTGLVCTGTATTHTWYQAINACAALNVGAFQGRTGWRLPFISELSASADPDAVAAPYVDSAFTMPTETRFWSNTGQDSSNAYAMNFANPAAVRVNKSQPLSVRCVTGHNRQTRAPYRAVWDSTSGTYLPSTSGPVIVEPASNLVWEQAPSTGFVTAATAATTCGTRHGTSGWRLPTAAHFTSIMALRYGANGFLTGATFANSTSCYWVAGAAGYCYTPNSGSLASASTTQPVWCVREIP
jgi:hypothetical protein